MINISFVIFAIYASSVYCSKDKRDDDEKHFNAFLEEIHGTAYKMEDFVDLVWPKIQEIVPETVELPGIEIYDTSTDHYMCATNTSVKVKLGKVFSTKLVGNTKEKTTLVVEAALHLDAKPVEFVVVRKPPNGKGSPAVPVCYHYKDPFRVRIVLEVQNFMGQKQISIPGCIMCLKSIMVVEVSDPVDVSGLSDALSVDLSGESLLDIEAYFLENFTDESLAVVGTVGLVKAVNDKLKTNSNYWICSSKDFDIMQQEYEKEWENSDNYNEYCGKKGSD